MLFAEVNWTEVVQTTGLAIAAVIAALGGWYLKILDKKNKHEMVMAETRAKIEAEERKELARLKAEQVERDQAASQRRDKEEHSREKGVIKELKELLNVSQAQHNEDRTQIHGLREAMNQLTMRVQVCEAQRKTQEGQIQDQTRQINDLWERLGEKINDQNKIRDLNWPLPRQALPGPKESPAENNDVG